MTNGGSFKAVRPGSNRFIEDEVADWIRSVYGAGNYPRNLSSYRRAVAALWPALDDQGQLEVAIISFMHVAQEGNFVIDESHFQVAA